MRQLKDTITRHVRHMRHVRPEAERGTASVRCRDGGKPNGMPLEELTRILVERIASRSLEL